MMSSKDILVIFISYAIGCLSSGYYLTLIFARQDIRKFNSGSTGARNVGRVLGGWGFAATFIIDIARGVLAAWFAKTLGVQQWAMMVSMIVLVCGHIWPLQLKFHGGKGIAVIIGFLLIFDYRIISLAGIILILVLIISRRYELSVFLSILVTPFTAFYTGHSIIEICSLALTAFIILVAHKENIIKFSKHTEERTA
jgi:glycerol-3-phosphate acyltransferase PlsY